MVIKMKFVAYLLLYSKIEGSEVLNETLTDMLTYLKEVDTLYIFNYHRYTQKTLIDVLKMYKNIEYVDLPNKGQVANYSDAIKHAVSINADYATVIEKGYFYEDNSFHEIKRMIIQNEIKEDVAVITPIPVLTCESKNDTKEPSREIKGAKLTGAFININIYKQTDGFYLPYYQTTFDYDYCLTVRQMGYKVLLMNNLILRNRNFKMLTKNFLWHHYYGYAREIYEVYYETRNRYYLWEKFKNLDPEYISIDKKLFKGEVREMSICDPLSRYKKDIMEDARKDALRGKMGKVEIEL
jgi:rhamnosyltransferase